MYEQKIFNPGNFKRHFIACHEKIAQRLNLIDENKERRKQPKTISKIHIETSRSNVLLGTLKMVTEHNLLIPFPEWEGIQLPLDPLWKACGLKISRNTIPMLIHRAAEIMRETMAGKFQRKTVCIKVDAATRHAKSILGINLSFTDDDGLIRIMHLGELNFYIKNYTFASICMRFKLSFWW